MKPSYMYLEFWYSEFSLKTVHTYKYKNQSYDSFDKKNPNEMDFFI